MTQPRKLILVLLPLGILGAGVVAFVGLAALRPPKPEPTVLERSAPEVEVASLAPRETRLDVIANGTVRARDTASLGPEVAGRVAFVASSLRAGSFVAAGEVLVRLDPREPTIALRSAEADLARAQAELRRLESSQDHLERDRELRHEQTRLAQADVKRLQRLYREGSVSEGALDQAQTAWLAARTASLAADRALDLLPHDLARARAARATAEAARDRARLTLDRLVLRSPLDAQVRSRSVEVGQVVTPGSTLARLEGHRVYEVAVQITHDDLTKLAQIPPCALPGALPVPPGLVGRAPAEVTWLAHPETPWQGHVTRIEPVDTRTRTLPVIVEIDTPWSRLSAGGAPLLKGAYCRIRLRGRLEAQARVVPERALREGDRIYVLRAGKLRILPVAVRHHADHEVVIESADLQAGDQLVLTPLTFPVEGMDLRPRESAK